MIKIREWLKRNHKDISYTIGGINIGTGIGCLLVGSILDGWVSLLIGTSFIYDAYMFQTNEN
jgi:hypothetical protein